MVFIPKRLESKFSIILLISEKRDKQGAYCRSDKQGLREPFYGDHYEREGNGEYEEKQIFEVTAVPRQAPAVLSRALKRCVDTHSIAQEKFASPV